MSNWKKYQKTYAQKEPVERRDFVPLFPLSEAQETLVEAMEVTDHNIHCEAVAGSGKSTSIAILAARNKIDSLYLAFNKDIVTDMESKLGRHVEVKTCHAYAYSMFRHAGVKGSVDQSKFFNIVKDNLMDWHPHRPGKDKNKWGKFKSLAKLFDMARLVRADMDDPQEMLNLITRYDIEFKDEAEQKQAARLIPKLEKISLDLVWNRGIIDFCEMIKIPLDYGRKLPRKEVLYLDECQDLSPLIREFSAKVAKRVVSVGDRHQCQPAGTMVLMKNCKSKPIEQIKKGDIVVGYKQRQGYVSPSCKVTEVASRYYEGNMHTFDCGGYQMECTPNHKCLVKWNTEAIKDKYVVYLMRKGNHFRIGKSYLYKTVRKNKEGEFGYLNRARQERADAVWIIQVCDSNEEAALYENYYSYTYGIPQLMFKDPMVKGQIFGQEMIDEFWDLIGDNSDKGNNILKAFQLDVNYPLWTNGAPEKQGTTTTFKVYACNVISGYMDMIIIHNYYPDLRGKTLKGVYCKASVRPYKGMVYSLNVEEAHTYVANNILTGNSIMGFAGADYSSVDKIKEQFDSLELRLDVCYRCPKKVIELAQQLVPHIQYFEKNPEGVINSFKADDFDFKVLPDSMVLSRRNSKLIRPCLEAIKSGRKAMIKGQDIGKDLAELAENMGMDSIEEFVNDVHQWKDKQKKAVLGRRDEAQALELIEDKAECLLNFSEGVTSPKTIPAKIKSVFSDTAGAGLIFSSMHKSKGLEADMVTIVDAGRMRIDRDGMSEEAKQQEANLEYVAKTRPKKTLNFVY